MPEEHETTNAVLKEKIDGLTRLTDERFSVIKDALQRIELAASQFATKVELEETKRDFNATIKRMEDAQAKHNADDIVSFGDIGKKLDFLTKVIYLGMGGLTVIEFAVQVWSNIHH